MGDFLVTGIITRSWLTLAFRPWGLILKRIYRACSRKFALPSNLTPLPGNGHFVTSGRIFLVFLMTFDLHFR